MLNAAAPHDNTALLLDTEAVEPRDGAVQPTQGKTNLNEQMKSNDFDI